MPLGVEGNATPSPSTQPKSKQDRIRDNQRRSRARRQEYLADLERRLSECQLTCRDADIERASLLELQIENGRLRELLALAGVNDQFVEHYVSQAVAQSGQFPQETNPSLRQLKPRVTGMESTRSLNGTAQLNPISKSAGSAPTQTSQNGLSTTSMAVPSMTVPPTPAPNYAAPFFVSSMPDLSGSSDFNWLYQPTPSLRSQDSGDEFCCDTFLIPTQGPARVADDSSILCSVAKQMIEQYHISPAEMETVKTKLAPGFCRPAYPGAGCAVNNQTLFRVLNELSSRYS
ncbi:hypothetical protein LTR70_000345 [Exophiala xenobiotica]|uniref:BZIP domain-containing protein n=1 Tax=Lithohypha guttulata TaxID=1690604 RepID=A0ABR0KPW5_9EURO|nr:hypothetical protein LTR24_000048 [Lithohypha guttulata]KAK5330515.1 hypothetical protein LTR70_000345 [Exophiala xenobiotica]